MLLPHKVVRSPLSFTLFGGFRMESSSQYHQKFSFFTNALRSYVPILRLHFSFPCSFLRKILNFLLARQRCAVDPHDLPMYFMDFPSTPPHQLTSAKTAENQWLHLPLITKLKKDCKEVFPTVEYAYTTIPTYPSGQIGFMVCCKDANRNVKEPIRSFTPEEEEKLCRYYNADIHRASFVLPTFARAALK